jgi:hypothetical protein
MHSASACSSPCHGSAHRVVHCHSTFSLLRLLKPQKEKTAFHFYLCLISYSSLSFISHCAYYNFPFLTVQLIFPSEQPTMHSHCMFLLTTSSTVTPQIFLGKNAQQLNRQPSKNHDSVLLTES